MNEQEFLTRVHASEGLRHAVLRAIEVDRASNICTFELVTDLPHTEEDEKAALAAVRAAVPQALRARVRFIKLVADEQLVRNKIKTYPVSYTHLDVYKRQVCYSTNRRAKKDIVFLLYESCRR